MHKIPIYSLFTRILCDVSHNLYLEIYATLVSSGTETIDLILDTHSFCKDLKSMRKIRSFSLSVIFLGKEKGKKGDFLKHSNDALFHQRKSVNGLKMTLKRVTFVEIA